MKALVIGQPVVDWVSEHGCDGRDLNPAVGFGIEQDGRLIAGVAFNDYNGANINMHVASDGSKRWMTRELLWMVFDYPFNQLKVKRITGLVSEGNRKAQYFDEHLGFVFETTLESAHPTGDLLVYRMFREDCRWLNMRIRHESYRKAA